MPIVRLQKFLAAAGECSRRKGEELIRAGRVQVNGRVVAALGVRVDPLQDQVSVDGRPVAAEQRNLYIALNKPRGYVTSCRHPGKKIVLELVNVPERIYPVGRLDKDSTGLLLLTNDGRLHLRSPTLPLTTKKEYAVVVERPIPNSALRRMAAGMPILNTRTRPAVVTRLGEKRFRIVLKEGRNRQIRPWSGGMAIAETTIDFIAPSVDPQTRYGYALVTLPGSSGITINRSSIGANSLST